MSALVRVLPGTPALVVDAGGPGRPVVDAMRVAGLKPIAVSITAGKRSRRANGMDYVPKRELVRGLVTAFETGRLKIAKGLPLAGVLMGELRAFQVKVTAKGRDTYAASNRVRSGAMKRRKMTNRYKRCGPIMHGLVGNRSCLAYGGY